MKLALRAENFVINFEEDILLQLQITAYKMQLFWNSFICTNAVHVSGGSSAHHQEHNCTYSFRYCQLILLLAATVEKMELRAVFSTVVAGSSIG
jgi:hypothetical protein